MIIMIIHSSFTLYLIMIINNNNGDINNENYSNNTIISDDTRHVDYNKWIRQLCGYVFLNKKLFKEDISAFWTYLLIVSLEIVNATEKSIIVYMCHVF